MKFVLTRELGRLVKWLRILGCDAEYFAGGKYSSLIIQALRDNRIILSRNQKLPRSRGIKTVLIENEKIKLQLKEVMEKLGIKPDAEKMFTRCILCNAELTGLDKAGAEGKVPEYVFKAQDKFVSCPKCGRIYWEGTHWGNVKTTLEEISR